MPEIGDTVVIMVGGTEGRKGPLNTTGLFGQVMRKDDAGLLLCVKLFISRVYMPCFWYREYEVVVRQPEFPWLTDTSIELALYGRRAAVPDTLIGRGCLRAWMLAKARVAEGQPLETLILRLTFMELLGMFADGTDRMYDRWITQYDCRPKRPRMCEGQTNASFIRIRRPKIGG